MTAEKSKSGQETDIDNIFESMSFDAETIMTNLNSDSTALSQREITEMRQLIASKHERL